jgi:hypothetical protein
LAKNCKKLFVVQKSKFFPTVTPILCHFYAKSAVKSVKSKLLILLCTNRRKWRHNDVRLIFRHFFCVFLSNFTTCGKISAHLEHFYESSILHDFSPKMTIFWPKWRHNDVTPKKKSIFDLQFFFRNFWQNFSPIEAFFRKLEGGVNIDPPNSNGG